MFSIRDLFSGIVGNSDSNVVEVTIGDLKRLISEKNQYHITMDVLYDDRDIMVEKLTKKDKEIEDLKYTINSSMHLAKEANDLEEKLLKLEEKLVLANALISSKNARLELTEVENYTPRINLYG